MIIVVVVCGEGGTSSFGGEGGEDGDGSKADGDGW